MNPMFDLTGRTAVVTGGESGSLAAHMRSGAKTMCMYALVVDSMLLLFEKNVPLLPMMGAWVTDVGTCASSHALVDTHPPTVFNTARLLAPLRGHVGGRDIGAACAIELARAGADVVVNYHSSSAAAEATVHEIEKLGRRAVAVQADVFGQEGVDILQAQAAAFFGTAADILVCNAGGLNQRGEL
jgi:hypothetical protein